MVKRENEFFAQLIMASKVIFYGFDGMFTICFYLNPQRIRVHRSFTVFFHQWRIHHSPWSIFILVLNINPINLLANFVAFALVGHSMVLNLFSSDNCENDGIKDPSFSNKIDLSLEKRGHWTKKWNSSSMGLGSWGDRLGDPILQYWQVLLCIGVTRVLNIPVAFPKKWLLALRRVK